LTFISFSKKIDCNILIVIFITQLSHNYRTIIEMPFNEEHYESNFNFHDESSFTSNDDYESNSLVDIYQDISADEYDFQDEDKEDLKYYIGLCLEDDDGRLLLGISISLEMLFKYDFDYIEQYLDYDNAPVTLEIMQLHISEDLTYYVVLKRSG
jgi:hypothetical protein